MTDSPHPPQQVWVIPEDPNDMAPLPALQDGAKFSLWDRRQKQFGPWEDGVYYELFQPVHATFEECRLAMIESRIESLDRAREHSRKLAASIEHIRTIPTATFPDVSREVREQEGQQEIQGQEKAQAEEVRPQPKPALKRPSRRV